MKNLSSIIVRIAFTSLIATLAACSAAPDLEPDALEPKVALPDGGDKDKAMFTDENDPWEGTNRRLYYFNAKFDEYVFVPVVNGYQYITPDPVEEGITNFFSNLGEFTTFTNSVLQFKFSRAGNSVGRFTINSTLGLLGLFDPASELGLYKEKEDFGQTLGVWGVGQGPYIMLPLLGPSNVRDTFGLIVDTVAYNAVVIDNAGLKTEEELALVLINAIDTKSNVPFRYYSTGSAFEYEYIRFLYGQARQAQIER